MEAVCFGVSENILLLPRKPTYSLKIDGYKMKIPVQHGSFSGDIRPFSEGYIFTHTLNLGAAIFWR